MVVADWLIGTGGGEASLGTGDGPRAAISGLAPRKGLPCALLWPPVADPADDRLRALADGREVQSHLATPNTGVYIVREDGHIVWASPSMEAVTGRAPKDLVGRNGWDVFVPPEDLRHVVNFRALLSEADGTIWMRLRMPGEARQWFRVDTMMREGGIVCAFRPEKDPARQHPHTFMRPRKP